MLYSAYMDSDLSHKSKLSDTNPGSLTIPSPLAFAEGLFTLKMNNFRKVCYISNIISYRKLDLTIVEGKIKI